MSLIDLTDLFFDPDIAGQSFCVIRRQQTINVHGEGVDTETRFYPIGQISPTGDNSLVREAAFQAQMDTIMVLTTFRLRAVAREVSNPGNLPVPPASATYQPDIVLFNGSHYVVQTLNEFTQFGGGFVEAECVSIDYVDNPPAPAPSSSPQ